MSTRQCPHCGAPLEADSTFCGACGSKIPATGRSCAKCATPLEEGDIFCPVCGHKNEPENQFAPREDPVISQTPDNAGVTPTYSGAVAKQRSANKSKTAAVVSGIVAFVLIVAAVVFFVIWNSPSHKEAAAAKAIHQCEFEKASKQLESLESQTATVMRNYMECAKEIENYRVSFISGSSAGDLAWNDQADMTIAAINNFGMSNDVSILPSLLQQDYRYFQEVAKELKSDRVTVDMLVKPQMAFYNLVIQHQPDTYTMKTLQENINTANSGITDLSSAVRNIPTLDADNPENTINLLEQRQYQELVEAGTVYITLIKKAQSACDTEQKRIDDNIEANNWTMDTMLSPKKPEPNYEYEIGCGLEPIDSLEDMNRNAQTMLKIMKVDLLAYYLQAWKQKQA